MKGAFACWYLTQMSTDKAMVFNKLKVDTVKLDKIKCIHIALWSSKCHRVHHKSVKKPSKVSCGSCVGCSPHPSMRPAVDYSVATRKLVKELFSSGCLSISNNEPVGWGSQWNLSGSWWHPCYLLQLKIGTCRMFVGQSLCVVGVNRCITVSMCRSPKLLHNI